jgi:uncharacterized protein (TIGR02118 family)
MPTIKRFTQWRPRRGLSRDEALRYWREEHARLVAKVPGVERYVQNYCLVGPDGQEPAYAGLGELWFADFPAAAAALATPEWTAVIDDASTFMDLDAVSATWAEEKELS